LALLGLDAVPLVLLDLHSHSGENSLAWVHWS